MFWVLKSCLMCKKLIYETIDRVILLVHEQVSRDVILERQKLLNSVLIQVYLLVQACAHFFIHSFIHSTNVKSSMMCRSLLKKEGSKGLLKCLALTLKAVRRRVWKRTEAWLARCQSWNCAMELGYGPHRCCSSSLSFWPIANRY